MAGENAHAPVSIMAHTAADITTRRIPWLGRKRVHCPRFCLCDLCGAVRRSNPFRLVSNVGNVRLWQLERGGV